MLIRFRQWLSAWMKVVVGMFYGSSDSSPSFSNPAMQYSSKRGPIESGTEKLIIMVNKLQDAFLSNGMRGLSLPQIAVVGGQSVGKSSVLESIVGRDFLPRGTGIVTRCPIILQCRHSKTEDYVEFLHIQGTKFTDYKRVSQEIVERTAQMAGSNKGIVETPIRLVIYSPRVMDLTLVDLPGITQNPVGDQPHDIEEQTTNLALSNVREPNCIILAVSAACDDIQNSQAMKIANSVDPTGERTIGVLTKLDLMDDGTNAVSILENRHFPLKHGYIGVKNRSQRDIVNEKDVEQARRDEENFLNQHSEYRGLHDRFGSQNLQKLLHRTLHEHIDRCLPQLRKDLIAKRSEADANLKGLFKKTEPSELLRKLLFKYKTKIVTDLSGLSEHIDLDEERAGAKINDVFVKRFPVILAKTSLPVVDHQKILLTLRNHTGYRHRLFTSEEVFHILTKWVTGHYKEKVKECVNEIAAVIHGLIEEAGELLREHPHLENQVRMHVDDFTTEKSEKTRVNLIQHIKVEMAFRNTIHPDFMKSRQGLDEAMTEKDDLLVNERQEKEISLMIDWYMDVVAKTVQDVVPKHVVYMQIKKFEKFVDRKLENIIRENNEVDKLLRQDEDKERVMEENKRQYAAADKAIAMMDEYFQTRSKAPLM